MALKGDNLNKIININITVREKIATADDVVYICGNSDYNIVFDFDDEWSEFETKTALFVYKGIKTPVVFTGNTCAVPAILNTYQIKVGVFAGNLHTITPAVIYARKSILCEGGTPADPPEDVYNQIMEKLNALDGATPATDEKLGMVRIGENLKITKDGVLSVDTADAVEKDNTKPVTSAAVHVEIGNIEVLLAAL